MRLRKRRRGVGSEEQLAGRLARTKNERVMLTGEIRNQIDQIWNAFWTGGISNPIEVIEQLTCLLFIKRRRL